VGQIAAKSGQTIENVHVTTTVGSCIVISGVSNVTIKNSEIGPCGSPGDANTQGVQINDASAITIQRNVIHDVSTGVYVSASRHPITMDRNYVYNVRGPLPRGQMIQMNGVSGGTARSRVTCNVSDAMPGNRYGVLHGNVTDGIEDHVSLYQSLGLPTDRTEIAYNRLRGGSTTSITGTGINMGDGPNSSGNNYAHENIVVNVTNVGIAISGGSNSIADNNRVYMNAHSTPFINAGMTAVNYSVVACTNNTFSNNRVWLSNNNPVYDSGNCDLAVVGNAFQDATLTEAIFEEAWPVACN
jgi:hypothetical protein